MKTDTRFNRKAADSAAAPGHRARRGRSEVRLLVLVGLFILLPGCGALDFPPPGAWPEAEERDDRNSGYGDRNPYSKAYRGFEADDRP